MSEECINEIIIDLFPESNEINEDNLKETLLEGGTVELISTIKKDKENQLSFNLESGYGIPEYTLQIVSNKYKVNIDCITDDDNQSFKPDPFMTDEEFKKSSSQIAEIEHHKKCSFECCGSHNDFIFDEKHLEKCPKCGMTEEEQQKHNDQVWSIIDNAEAKLLEKYNIMWKHEDPEDCDHSDHIDFCKSIGKMQEDGLDSVYNVPFFCPNCNYFVKEVYNYEGLEVF